MNQQNLLLFLLIFFSFVELNLSTTNSSIPPNIKEVLQHKGENKISLSNIQNEKEQVNNNKVSDDNKDGENKYHYYMKKGAAGGHGGGSGGGRGVGGGNSNAIHHPANNNNKKSNGVSLHIHPLTPIIITFSLMICFFS